MRLRAGDARRWLQYSAAMLKHADIIEARHSAMLLVCF